MYRSSILLSTLGLLSLELSASSLQHSESTQHLTLYQSDRALINSSFNPSEAADRIIINGLPEGLLPASVHLEGVELLTQRWSAGVSFEHRLHAVTGEAVTLEHLETGETRSGRLLGFNGNHLEFEYQHQVMRYPLTGNWQPRLPAYHPSQTELELGLSRYTSEPFSLSYLTQGLSWAPEYQVELISDNRINLVARAALHNRSGADFKDTSIDLLAGKPDIPAAIRPQVEMAMRSVALESPPQLTVSETEGYQLFHLPGTYTLPRRASVRVPLFELSDLDAQVKYRMSHSVDHRIDTRIKQQFARQGLSFELAESQVDKPLPAGEVQLFRRDDKGRRQFVGSQPIAQHSPGERVEFDFGEVFDLRAERRQTDYQRNGNASTQTFTLRFTNAGSETRVLEYQLSTNAQWNLLEASQLATVDGMQARWLIELPANSSQTLSYTLRIIR